MQGIFNFKLEVPFFFSGQTIVLKQKRPNSIVDLFACENSMG
jgi:hypothetical protein